VLISRISTGGMQGGIFVVLAGAEQPAISGYATEQ
jgi:hypothetical protein